MTDPATEQTPTREELQHRFDSVREFSEAICRPFAIEDYVVQTMPDVSPTKWHLAHVSWFFETFILEAALKNYYSPDPLYAYLYNSYYNALGDRHCRPRRGQLSRPTVAETYRYRSLIDDRMRDFLNTASSEQLAQFAPLVTLGINHEQQHQELMITDIKHVLGSNPLLPSCVWTQIDAVQKNELLLDRPSWLAFPGGIERVGWDGTGFAFDNEGPQHSVWVEPFEISTRPVTNGDWISFIADDGYRRADLWLSMGWDLVQTEHWSCPLYWERQDGTWKSYTFNGLVTVDPDQPVSHVSFFEADAYARWSGARLPTEEEWEIASANAPKVGQYADSFQFHPQRPLVTDGSPLGGMFGHVWEWTSSAYLGYPGYTAAAGAVGEYNGKFMCNQFVLRGGSCATHSTHIRPTYRNFFPPDARWQFSGLRLAR